MAETASDPGLLRDGERMKLSVQGKDAEWTDEIREKWEAVKADWKPAKPPEPQFPVYYVWSCNYFRPRPYVDEYNRGSPDEGFVYTTSDRKVWQSIINR